MKFLALLSVTLFATVSMAETGWEATYSNQRPEIVPYGKCVSTYVNDNVLKTLYVEKDTPCTYYENASCSGQGENVTLRPGFNDRTGSVFRYVKCLAPK